MSRAVRNLVPDDVCSALELSIAANWNQTPEDWYRILHLAPGGCRCIDDAGKVIATTTLLPYGACLAWIGMVLTSNEHRRQGLARMLIEGALATAEQRAIRVLKLDATDEGRPLYENLGFVVEQQVERWARNGEELNYAKENDNHAHPLSGQLFSLDTEAFGASRRALLESLANAGACNAAPEGFVFSRPGRAARYLGPCVARSETTAAHLITAHLEANASESGWHWDLLPSNRAAVRCAESLGFTRRRVLWRMSRGAGIEKNDAMVYAIAGFELG
jgi:GNAT superfamily N-acetyltransferase